MLPASVIDLSGLSEVVIRPEHLASTLADDYGAVRELFYSSKSRPRDDYKLRFELNGVFRL